MESLCSVVYGDINFICYRASYVYIYLKTSTSGKHKSTLMKHTAEAAACNTPLLPLRALTRQIAEYTSGAPLCTQQKQPSSPPENTS